jgi:hypothetical protein
MFANLAIKRVPHFVGFMARFFHRTLSQIFAAADPDGSGKLLLGMKLASVGRRKGRKLHLN